MMNKKFYTKAFPVQNDRSMTDCIFSLDGIDDEVYISAFSEFLRSRYPLEIERVLEEPDERKHYGIQICAKWLLEDHMRLGSLLLFHAEKLLPLFDKALIEAQKRIMSDQHSQSQSQTQSQVHSPSMSRRSQSQYYSQNSTCSLNGLPLKIKELCHVRVAYLPPGFRRPNVSSVRASDFGHFVEMPGTTIRTGRIKMLEQAKTYICGNKTCGYQFRVEADLAQGGLLNMPKKCPSADDSNAQTQGGRRCKSSKFNYVDGSRVCCDYQEVRIQERVSSLSVGMIPRQITVILRNDLVDTCKPGDDVIVTGIVMRRWQQLKKKDRMKVELVILAYSVRVSNATEAGGQFLTDEVRQEFEDFWENACGIHLPVDAIRRPIAARNHILRSLCPQICGMLFVKLAVALVLVGGCGVRDTRKHPHKTQRRRRGTPGNEQSNRNRQSVNTSAITGLTQQRQNTYHKRHRVSESQNSSSSYGSNSNINRSSNNSGAMGLKLRGEAHLLLIGDPGLGKSQFLRFATLLSNRSVLTTGVGTTSAGLTCAAVKDGSEWSLEGGALVLSDRGICCIDEFSSIREHDRATIHEAMEQQTLSVAKAGLCCTLNTRTAVLAACNPKGRYDPYKTVSENTDIATPLLSRFDIVLVLQDKVNKVWDKKVSNFILDSVTKGGLQGDYNRNNCDVDNPFGEIWSLKRLKAYIGYVKATYFPVMTKHAEKVLHEYYLSCRTTTEYTSMDSAPRDSGRTTIRMLESLVRLSEAHARFMCRNTVIIDDAIVAIMLTEASQNLISKDDFATFDNDNYAVQNSFCIPSRISGNCNVGRKRRKGSAVQEDFPETELADTEFRTDRNKILDRLKLLHGPSQLWNVDERENCFIGTKRNDDVEVDDDDERSFNNRSFSQSFPSDNDDNCFPNSYDWDSFID
eukprot:g3314.t1